MAASPPSRVSFAVPIQQPVAAAEPHVARDRLRYAVLAGVAGGIYSAVTAHDAIVTLACGIVAAARRMLGV